MKVPAGLQHVDRPGVIRSGPGHVLDDATLVIDQQHMAKARHREVQQSLLPPIDGRRRGREHFGHEARCRRGMGLRELLAGDHHVGVVLPLRRDAEANTFDEHAARGALGQGPELDRQVQGNGVVPDRCARHRPYNAVDELMTNIRRKLERDVGLLVQRARVHRSRHALSVPLSRATAPRAIGPFVEWHAEHMTTGPTPPTIDTFPRQHARTRRLTLGEPRAARIAPDGERIAFLRSDGGNDAVTRLRVLEPDSAGVWKERLVADPTELARSGDSDLPAAERARRERLRESAEGITAIDTDREVRLATFALSGQLFVADLLSGEVRSLANQPGAFDPRLSPDGRFVAYVSNQCLHVVPADGRGEDRLVMGEDDANVSWGMPDFIAAEELNRYRGFWWSPDSSHLVAARVDESPVQTWFIADPAHPSRQPSLHRYPVAGSANAELALAVFDVETLARTDVTWSHEELPYLVDVQWTEAGLICTLMNRTQTVQRTCAIDPASGGLSVLREVTDPVWVELTPGTPVLRADGSLVVTIETASGVEGTCALAVVSAEPDAAAHVVTPAGLQIRRVVGADATHAIVAATAAELVPGLDIPIDPGCIAIVRVPLAPDSAEAITVLAGGPDDPGIHSVDTVGALALVRSVSVNRLRADYVIRRSGSPVGAIENRAEVALVHPRPTVFRVGRRGIPCAVFVPSDTSLLGDGTTKLPVLLDPYAGPHAQRVVAARNAHVSSQWFADQGFVVLVADGRGTPGLGPRYEREVHLDLAGPVLDDQIEALHEAAVRYPLMDLDRVAIRGWSFGGYLAALAVLRRPDVFHAAIAGAPVTEWRLYDTAYTERYLGNPADDPSAYDRCSLLSIAGDLIRPLMIIHGLADDNVVAAHTLQLSSALLAHGRPHEVLPLSGVTHMTPQEVVAENLLKLQVDFLRRSLARP